MQVLLQPVILSGGSGTRLWPLSRGAYPKQFLSLHGKDSLLATTVRRICRLMERHNEVCVLPIRLIANDAHRFLVAEEIRLTGHDLASIVLEPFGRNTAPPLTFAALLALREELDPVLVVLPSDHVIVDEERFRDLAAHGARLAEQGRVVTFGIVPTRAESGFGYLRKGTAIDEFSAELLAFIEKPEQDKANRLIESGEYLWNSGIFMMKASVWIREIRNHHADILAACEQALDQGTKDGIFFRIDAKSFEKCPNLSIDHAVMEKLVLSEPGIAAVIPMDVGWSDIGSWSALHDVKSRDPHGNVAHGDVFSKDSRNSLLYAQSRLLVTLGVNDLIVVETKDAVLVAHRDNAQDIKSVTDYLKSEKRPEHEFHRKVHRPWGSFELIDDGPRYQVKRLSVKPGASLSLQMHHHRAEHWIVVSGTARVTRGEESFLISENESTYIPLGIVHRLENPGTLMLEIIEVQSGSYLGENDIVRFADRYNRVSSGQS